MPTHDRRRAKGRQEGGSFCALPHSIFRSTEDRPAPAARLSRSARALLVDIAMQFSGGNNGNLTAAPTIMSRYGWRSRGTLSAALAELIAEGFLEITRQGGRNRASLYALTWKGIDAGPHDAPPSPVPSRLFLPENEHRRDERHRRRWREQQRGAAN
jgi:hypothetical protein